MASDLPKITFMLNFNYIHITLSPGLLEFALLLTFSMAALEQISQNRAIPHSAPCCTLTTYFLVYQTYSIACI